MNRESNYVFSRLTKPLASAFVGSLVWASLAFSQGNPNAMLQGTVQDRSGAAIPGARVTVSNDGTKVSDKRTTDQAGRYIFTDLHPSSYTVTVEAQGFKTLVRPNVVLRVDQKAAVDFTLDVGSVTTRVEVKGAAPLLNSASASLGQDPGFKLRWECASTIIPGESDGVEQEHFMFRLFRGGRDALKKWLLAFFLGIMALGMIGVVTPFFSGGDSNQMQMSTLAEIGGVSITTQDVQRSIDRMFRNSRQNYDPKFVPAMAGTVLDELVLRRAVASQAKKLGLEVSDEELLQSLRTIPWLYSNGTFLDPMAYENVVAQQTGMGVREFEAQFRESLLMDKIRSVATDGVQVSPEDVRQEFQRRNTKAKIEYVLFEPTKFEKDVQVTPQALEAFFKKDPGRYNVSEQCRIRYFLIDADHVRAQARVSEEQVRQYYEQHLAEHRVQDRVKIAHILFKTTGKSPAEVATLEKTARDVLAQIKAGADFAEVAKKYSEDSSASNGGTIGWIGRGQTVKEFEAAAFSMNPGQVSGLIRTTYGIHIIKVLDHQTAHLQTFDEVKDSIRTELEKQKFDLAQQYLSDDLERQLKSNPGNFEAIARKAGLEVNETPLFRYNQTIPDFGKSEAFANLAFELRKGEVGTPITVPKGTAIIQVAEIVPEHAPKLEEVQARIEPDFRAAEAKTLALEKAQEFAARCKTGDFGKLAQAAHLTLKQSKDFTEQDYLEGLASGSALPTAFTLAPRQVSDVVPVGSNHLVFRVISHTAPNEADFAAQRDRITEDLLQRKRNIAFEIYRQNLKQQLLELRELKMNDAGMKQFLALFQKS